MENLVEPILLIINGLDIGHQHGGAEKFAAELALSLQESGWQIHLAALTQTGSEAELLWKKRLETGGVQLVFLNSSIRRNLIRSISFADHLCQEHNINLVHSHCQIGSLVAAWLRIRGRVKLALRTVYITQEWGISSLAWFMRTVFSKFFFPIVFDAQVAVSQAICNKNRSLLGVKLARSRIVYIPNSIPNSWFELDKGQPIQNKSAGKGPIFGTVGVINVRKGQRDVIKAFALIQQTYPEAQLWLIGDGPERPALETLAEKLGIAHQVRFWGQRHDVQILLDQLDLFVLASFAEGLPIVVIESMAHGIPVIATDIPGNRELVEDQVTGRLFPAGDVKALAETIQQALHDPQKTSEMAIEARNRIGQFNMITVGNEYSSLYKHLLIDQSKTI